MSDLFKIRINNWEKYNAKNDGKKHSWIRMQVNLFDDPKVHLLNASGKLMWVYCLLTAGSSGDHEVTIACSQVSQRLRMKSHQVITSISRLVELSMISYAAPRSKINSGVPTNERTNETNEQSKKKEKPKLDSDESVSIVGNLEPVQKKKPKPKTASQESLQPVIDSYWKAFQSRFGVNSKPVLSGKEIGQLKNLAKAHKLSVLDSMFQIYFQTEDNWLHKRSYDLGTFISNQQRFYLAAQSGVDPTDKMSEWMKEEMEKEKSLNGGAVKISQESLEDK